MAVKLNEVKRLTDEIIQLRSSGLELTREQHERLWHKLRLEWNYNSNHIEGNTLTYDEVELLLIFQRTDKPHEYREYAEMKAHDVALELVRKWAEENREITEADIRNLNKIILVEPFYKKAITSEFAETRKEIIPGKYKDQPNHVLRADGTIFKYAEPGDVSIEMHKLLEWYRNSNDHPIVVAAILHYKFILIHPFDDGNGRIARLLMNYHLIKNKYLPAIIKSSDKKNYLFALQAADIGNIESFINYIASQAIWSLNLYVMLLKGEEIEEFDDWKKELKQIQNTSLDHIEQRSQESFRDVFYNIIIPTIEFIHNELANEFNVLFQKNRFILSLDNNDITAHFRNRNLEAVYDHFLKIENTGSRVIKNTFTWEDYKHNGLNIFSLKFEYLIEFELYYYAIAIPELADSRIKKSYKEKLDQGEINYFISRIGNQLIYQVQKHLKK